MLVSKRIDVSLIIFISLLLTACFKPSVPKDTKVQGDSQNKTFNIEGEEQLPIHSNQYTFQVVKMSARGKKLIYVTKDGWQYAKTKHYIPKICVQDQNTKKSIPEGFPFYVDVSGEVIEVKTDDSGCFEWNDSVNFDHFAYQARYILKTYRISGKGTHKGWWNVQFAFNPWSELRSKGKGISPGKPLHQLDLNHKEKANLVYNQAQLDAQTETAKIRLEKVDSYKVSVDTLRDSDNVTNDSVYTNFQEKINGIEMEGLNAANHRMSIDLSLRPKAEVVSVNGKNIQIPVDSGRFKVYAHIVAEGVGAKGSQSMMISGNFRPGIAEIRDDSGILNVNVQTNLVLRATNKELKLVLRMVPLGPGKDMKAYDGLFQLGRFERLIGKGSLPLDPKKYLDEDRFDYDKYVNKSLEAVGGKITDTSGVESFEMTELSVQYSYVGEGETATKRSISFTMKTCFSDPFTGTKLGYTDFDYQLETSDASTDRSKPESESEWGEWRKLDVDKDGCGTIYHSVLHKYYEVERFYFPKAHVYMKSSGKKYKRTLVARVNPWADSYGVFGQDGSKITNHQLSKIQAVLDSKPPSRFFLNNFSYVTQQFRYEIDRFLQLKVFKTVLLRTNPFVLRYSSLKYGRRAIERLRDGIYLMKIGILKDYLDPTSKGIAITSDHKDMPSGANSAAHIGVLKKSDGGVFKIDTSKEALKTIEPKQFITVEQKLVRVNAGHIITPVELSMTDLRLMRIRSQMLIQLETINEEELFKANVLEKSLNENQVEVFRKFKMGYSSETVEKMINEFTENRERVLTDDDTRNDNEFKYLFTEKERRYFLNHLMRRADTSEFIADQKVLQKQLKDIKNAKSMGLNQLHEQLRTLEVNDLRKEAPYIDIKGLEVERTTSNGEKVHDVIYGFDNKIIDRAKLERNNYDFTLNSAAPNVDLSTLIDTNSGLSARTFVGPVTFLLNGNHSSVRPTDNLDESFCTEIDCGQIKANDRMHVYQTPSGKGETFSGKEKESAFDMYFSKLLNKDEDQKNLAKLRDEREDAMEYDKNKAKQKKSSQYYGDISYLENIQVDHLIMKKQERDQEELGTMKAKSSSALFVRSMNVTHVDLKDRKLEECVKMKRKTSVSALTSESNNSGHPDENVECFPTDQYSQLAEDFYKKDLGKGLSYIYQFKDYDQPEADAAKMKSGFYDWLKYYIANHEMDTEHANHNDYKSILCNKLTHNIFDQYNLIAKRGSTMDSFAKFGSFSFVYNACILGLEKNEQLTGREKRRTSPFHTETKLFVKNIHPGVIYKGGKSMNINVGSHVGIGKSMKIGMSKSVSPTETMKSLFGMIPGVSALFNFTGFNIRVSDDKGTTKSSGANISQGTYLAMQQATVNFSIKEFDQCMILKWNPAFMDELFSVFGEDSFNRLKERRLTLNSLLMKSLSQVLAMESWEKEAWNTALDRGFLLCDGERHINKDATNELYRFDERYYYFTQHFTEGDILDPGDIYNHPWLLRIRGDADFVRFLTAMQADPAPFTYDDMFNKSVDQWAAEKLKFPMDRLTDVYLNFVPSYYGVYTPLKDEVQFPPSSDLYDIIYGETNEEIEKFKGKFKPAYSVKSTNALQQQRDYTP
ncbi:MAG: hypothetical protein HOO06_10485 [Bdellovibrionaceae bacterium]|jgi:hypothetical protein|nr:hypothetical protein [Pseudobdellovibrionaceae bacterium]